MLKTILEVSSKVQLTIQVKLETSHTYGLSFTRDDVSQLIQVETLDADCRVRITSFTINSQVPFVHDVYITSNG